MSLWGIALIVAVVIGFPLASLWAWGSAIGAAVGSVSRNAGKAQSDT